MDDPKILPKIEEECQRYRQDFLRELDEFLDR